jgi:hypothetical protein
MTSSVPIRAPQSTVASPAASMPTAGYSAVTPAAESFSPADQPPPAGRLAASTAHSDGPILTCQAATASPSGSIATWGKEASWPLAERFTGASQPPRADLLDAWTILPPPSGRSQTATAFPAASIATPGKEALWPLAERSTGIDQGPSAELIAAWTM